jgi:FMN reductase
MRIAVVVGNPKADSRTLRVALAVSDALATRLDADSERLVMDLADVADEIHQPESPTMDRLVNDVITSDLVIVASPTFKATYTGLLKSFFDRFATNALSSVIAVGVMTGAAPVHALAVEVYLRPLLVELGALTPTRGLYVTEQQFEDLDAAIGPWADEAAIRIEPRLV